LNVNNTPEQLRVILLSNFDEGDLEGVFSVAEYGRRVFKIYMEKRKVVPDFL